MSSWGVRNPDTGTTRLDLDEDTARCLVVDEIHTDLVLLRHNGTYWEEVDND